MPVFLSARQKEAACGSSRSFSAYCRCLFAARAVLFELLCSSHACLFDAFRQKEAACGILRSYSAYRAAGVVRSQGFLRSSDNAGSFERVRFLFRRRGNEGWRRNAFTYCISLWLCYLFRGEYAGAARPRLRQRAIGSLDSLHAAAGWAITNSKHCKKPHGLIAAQPLQHSGTLETRPTPIYGRASRVAAPTHL